MATNLLIILGCSWTYGVGVCYVDGMSTDEFRKQAWDHSMCDQLSWRGVLAKKIDADNHNLSQGGSSNQRQFRMATEFFSSQQFKRLQKSYDKIIVLWGITSTARNEVFSLEKKEQYNFFYTENKDNFSKFFTKYVYDHDNEVRSLKYLMLHWNDFFKAKKVKNFWFDTFNTHDYNKIHHGYSQPEDILDDVENLIDADKNPRDIAFMLATNHGFKEIDDQFHYSSWEVDNKKIKFLRDMELVNPISLHPTIRAHEEIADFFLEAIRPKEDRV